MTMTVSTTSSGALARLKVGGLSLIQYPATEFEGGPANLWLHLHDAAHPLTGPASHSSTSHTSGITVVNGTIEGYTTPIGSSPPLMAKSSVGTGASPT